MYLLFNFFVYQVWANENGFESIAFKACGASKGRWWSVVQSFSDVYLHRAAYRGWCEHMAKALGTSSTYQHIYVETASWLQNDKVICDLSFVLAFHEEWWNNEMLFAQGISVWQKEVPTVHQRAGYRAAEYVTHTVLAHRKLSSLRSTEVILSLDSFKKNYAGHCEGLDAMPCTNGEDSTQAFMDKQAVHFVETALETYATGCTAGLKIWLTACLPTRTLPLLLR